MNVQALRDQIVYVANRNKYGEESANNDGEFIRAMGGIPGEEWCALYGNYCIRRAHSILGYPDPQWCWRRYPARLETGAKGLIKAMARQPNVLFFKDPKLALPGDIVVWDRVVMLVPWWGHLGVVTAIGTDGWPWANEGNVGKFPARVITRRVKGDRLYGFAGFR